MNNCKNILMRCLLFFEILTLILLIYLLVDECIMDNDQIFTEDCEYLIVGSEGADRGGNQLEERVNLFLRDSKTIKDVYIDTPYLLNRGGRSYLTVNNFSDKAEIVKYISFVYQISIDLKDGNGAITKYKTNGIPFGVVLKANLPSSIILQKQMDMIPVNVSIEE